MMTLTDMADPAWWCFHPRLVRGLDGFDSAALLEACREHFALAPQESASAARPPWTRPIAGAARLCPVRRRRLDSADPEGPGGNGQLLPDKSQAYRLLDVSILHSLVLERLLGIDKEIMASQKNLTYTRSAQEAEDSVRQGESQCCFLLNPTRVEEIGQVAQNGEKMPQKSTYFYPKLITGLVMNSLEES